MGFHQLRDYCLYVAQVEISMLIMTGQLLELPPKLRKEVQLFKIPGIPSFQGSNHGNSRQK